MAYATIAELEERLGHAVGNQAQAQALLDDAAALINSFTRRSFEFVENDELVLRPIGLKLRLPRPPVREIHSVFAIGGAEGIPDFQLHGWVFDGVDIIDLAPIDPAVWVQLPERWLDGSSHTNTYRVVYDHGYPPGEIPDDIRVINLAAVLRILTAPSPVEGLVSESIGQYNYQMQQGTGSFGLGVRLTKQDKETLSVYRRKSSTIQVRT